MRDIHKTANTNSCLTKDIAFEFVWISFFIIIAER